MSKPSDNKLVYPYVLSLRVEINFLKHKKKHLDY